MLRTTTLNNFILILLLIPFTALAQDFEIKGLLKSLTSIDSYGGSSIMDIAGDETAMVEERVVGRIMVKSDIADDMTLHVHYENSFSKGEYLSAVEALRGRTGYIKVLEKSAEPDSKQLFSMTQEYEDKNGELAYHRIDRLYAEYARGDFNLRFGRQALTWGSGKVFNPIDIMNPFAPTDVIRDYKNGSDMFAVQAYSALISDIQAALVPRRNPDTQELMYSESSAALKLKNTYGETDAEALFGMHYGEAFAGGGVSAFIGGAALRADVLISAGEYRDYVTAVTNIDYSWLFLDNNAYGFLEFYYNSLGVDSIDKMIADRELSEKLAHGDMFLRDRYYAAAGVQYELHPLINVHFSMIYNLNDASYIIQPRLEWDIRENMRIFAGIDLPEGNLGSEFGGFYDQIGGGVIAPAKRAYGQVALYF